MGENRYMEQREKEYAMKQSFLSAAISDISAYIQLSDQKVSIIMAALTVVFAGAMACYEPIARAFSKIAPCSWQGAMITVLFSQLGSFVMTFFFGILTIRRHVSGLAYDSKWYLTRKTGEYSFDSYKEDIDAMTDSDVIENMAAELYKLNDINRQKSVTVKWTVRFFAATLGTTAVIGLLLLTANL